MERSQQTAEPSMDEILASIRRIIAEEPAQSKSSGKDMPILTPAALPPNPLFGAAPPRNSAPAPVSEKSSGAQPKGLQQVIDDDLAELLTERLSSPAAANGSGATSRPSVPSQPATPFDNADAAWRMLEDKMGTKLGGPADAPANANAVQPESAPSTDVNSRPPASAPAPFFPSLRSNSTGFYPPQNSQPAKPAAAPADMPLANGVAPGAERAYSNGSAQNDTAMTGAPARKSEAPLNTPVSARADTVQVQSSVPLPPRPITFDGPSASPFPPAPSPRAAAHQAAVPDGPDAQVTAASALGALAEGLAASGVPAAAMPLAAYSPASKAAEQAPSGATAPVRTLEDAVADMLRPLLQQWLADNMPRIIEKALRVETARAIKDGMKQPNG